MRQRTKTILTVAATSGDNTSDVVDLAQVFQWSVQYSFVGGTPSSSFKVQGSNDNSVWSTVSTTAISAAGSGIINLGDVGYAYGRVVNTYTSGTSALTVTVSTKGA